MYSSPSLFSFFFFFNDTATTEIYTLSLHDALPISPALRRGDLGRHSQADRVVRRAARLPRGDRKSTRLNSSHLGISYAVFCLKKKKNKRATKLLRAKGTTAIPSRTCGSWQQWPGSV